MPGEEIIAVSPGLSAPPEAGQACGAVRPAGVRAHRSHNGSAEARKPLERFRLDAPGERVISTGEAPHWKARRADYLQATQAVDVEPQHLAFGGGTCLGCA